jgi:HEAT repeat protein
MPHPEPQHEPGPAWALVERLGCADPRERMAVVARLRALGPAALPAVERGLAWHPKADVRRWCAYLLAESGLRASAWAVLAATHDRVAAVRLLALRALADPGRMEQCGVDPCPHLVRLARHDRSKRVRRAALEALAQRLPDPRAAAVLAEAVEDPRTDPEVRRRCARALDEVSPPAARSLLLVSAR